MLPRLHGASEKAKGVDSSALHNHQAIKPAANPQYTMKVPILPSFDHWCSRNHVSCWGHVSVLEYLSCVLKVPGSLSDIEAKKWSDSTCLGFCRAPVTPRGQQSRVSQLVVHKVVPVVCMTHPGICLLAARPEWDRASNGEKLSSTSRAPVCVCVCVCTL